VTSPVLNAMKWRRDGPAEALLAREWLVTNGLGGYASGTVSGACTRRFHGLLVAALPAPLGRTIMLNHLAEELELPGGKLVHLGGEEGPGGALALPGACELSEFRLEMGLPVWRFESGGVVLEKRVLLPHQQNTVHITYRVLSAPAAVKLRLRPSMFFRPHEGPVAGDHRHPYRIVNEASRHEVHGPSDHPPLRLQLTGARGAALVLDGGSTRRLFYRVEHARGYDHEGTMWSPGHFRLDLAAGEQGTLVASTEPWEQIDALSPVDAQHAELDRRRRLLASADPRVGVGEAAELVLAGDQFVTSPTTRVIDATQAHAAGDEARTIIAGYHWFTDWGRDTMISLEGLTLVTGRHAEAGYILRTFARHVRDGLIPNLFPEGEREALYHTADASLWFFHAVDRYLEATGDRATLEGLLPTLIDVMDHHLRGTRFGIGVDPADGLLSQGAEGFQLTWMDAKVDGWVVTPRRGKAVEINALFYNSLRLLADWVRDAEGNEAAAPYARAAGRARASFNARFWYAPGAHLYDVVDGEAGDDPALRPNQIFSLSLRHPVLDQARWADVVASVERELVTPVGLRSLSPRHPDYKPKYDGDLRSRDAAYHQGTVWAWLIGPFLDAWLRVHPDRRAEARRFLVGFGPHLGDACLGSISEIFDAEPPFTPRGCVAQAWSVAEVLRSLVRLAG
jgi:predicted glycogen debranching enzyme